MDNNKIKKLKSSFNESAPPVSFTVYGKALWFAGKGLWENAHNLVQNIHNSPAAHIHAYLHRLEGDNSNASYWYSKANEKMPEISLKAEWENLVEQYVD
jgi:hypothetical protein